MLASADQLFREALTLSPEARAELTDRLIASAAETIDPEIEQAHLEEVRRRIARVATGEVELVPGEQVLAEGRALLATLSRDERLRLVEDLWDSIAEEGGTLPFPEWKHEELRHRKERFLQNPALGLSWEEVKRRVRPAHD